MTSQIANLQILKSIGTLAAVTLAVNFASCQLSRFAWFAARQAFNLACGVSLAIWNSQSQVLVFQHVVGCPVAALGLLRSILGVVAGAF